MITGLYSGLLGLLYFKLSLDTIMARKTFKVPLGSGPNNEIAYLVSAHSNFASYVPLLLFMLYLAELNRNSAFLLHALGMTFLLGRIIHYQTMKDGEKSFKFRKTGMMLTLWPLIILSCISIWDFLKTKI